VNEVKVMKEGHASEELPGKVLNLGTGKRDKPVAFEKIKDTLA
jgi:hypothetical protein